MNPEDWGFQPFFKGDRTIGPLEKQLRDEGETDPEELITAAVCDAANATMREVPLSGVYSEQLGEKRFRHFMKLLGVGMPLAAREQNALEDEIIERVTDAQTVLESMGVDPRDEGHQTKSPLGLAQKLVSQSFGSTIRSLKGRAKRKAKRNPR